jgi:hypothetical protein
MDRLTIAVLLGSGPSLLLRHFTTVSTSGGRGEWQLSRLLNGNLHRKHPTRSLQERGQCDITEEVWRIMCSTVGERTHCPSLSKCETGGPAEPPWS